MTARQGGWGGVLRLRNLATIDNVRRAADPAGLGEAWTDVRPRREPTPGHEAHADALKEELRWTPLHCADFQEPRGG
jgi:hypothetical protein